VEGKFQYHQKHIARPLMTKRKEVSVAEVQHNYQYKYQANCNCFKENGEVMDKTFNDLVLLHFYMVTDKNPTNNSQKNIIFSTNNSSIDYTFSMIKTLTFLESYV
jgi:hypothetical protein